MQLPMVQKQVGGQWLSLHSGRASNPMHSVKILSSPNLLSMDCDYKEPIKIKRYSLFLLLDNNQKFAINSETGLPTKFHSKSTKKQLVLQTLRYQTLLYCSLVHFHELCFLNSPNQVSFCLFSLFSNTNFYTKTVIGFIRIRICIVGVK